MPLEKLSKAQLEGRTGRGANSEYVGFLKGLKVGDGGRAVVAQERATRQTVKNRLNAAATEAGVKIKFLRSSPEEVVFKVVG